MANLVYTYMMCKYILLITILNETQLFFVHFFNGFEISI